MSGFFYLSSVFVTVCVRDCVCVFCTRKSVEFSVVLNIIVAFDFVVFAPYTQTIPLCFRGQLETRKYQLNSVNTRFESISMAPHYTWTMSD